MGYMEVIVIVIVSCHPLAAVIVTAVLGRRLYKARSLRFPISAAVLLMLLIGVLLGALIYEARNSSLTPLGVVVILTPLPVWVIAGAEWLTLRNKASMIAVKEAVGGALTGIVAYGVITLALFGFMNAMGVH